MPWYRVFSLSAWFFCNMAISFCLMLEICLSHLSYMTAWSVFFLHLFLHFFSVKYFVSVIYFTDNAPMRLSSHILCYYLKFWLYLTWAKLTRTFHVTLPQWTVDGVPGSPPEVSVRSRVVAGLKSESGHARTLPQSTGVGTVPVPCMNLHHVYLRNAQVSNGVWLRGSNLN